MIVRNKINPSDEVFYSFIVMLIFPSVKQFCSKKTYCNKKTVLFSPRTQLKVTDSVANLPDKSDKFSIIILISRQRHSQHRHHRFSSGCEYSLKKVLREKNWESINENCGLTGSWGQCRQLKTNYGLAERLTVFFVGNAYHAFRCKIVMRMYCKQQNTASDRRFAWNGYYPFPTNCY